MNLSSDLVKCNQVVNNIEEDLLFLLYDLDRVPNLNTTSENVAIHVQEQIASILETHIYRDYEDIIMDHNQSKIVKNEKLGRVPDGYIKVYGDDGRVSVEIDPDRQEVIQYIFEACDSGTKKCHLVNDLEEMGYTSSTGKKIRSSTINDILGRRNIYQGGYSRGGCSFPRIL